MTLGSPSGGRSVAATAVVSIVGLVLHNLAEFPVQILIGPETPGPLAFGGSGSIVGAPDIQAGAER